jgi:transcriptional regulator with XRE-family HTH domain
MALDESELSDRESRRIAALVREELARRRISRQRLADDARISLSTLEKALSGRRPFTLATTVRLESALGVSLRGAPATTGGQAPDSLGAYSRAAVSWLEGRYLTLRPSFDDAGAIYAYRTDIRWSEAASRLVFAEADRLDTEFSQKGEVALPHQSGHLYLVTNDHGQHRLIILSRPTIGGQLYGLLATLKSGPGSNLTPAATPIALIPITGCTPTFGKVREGQSAFAGYRAHLDRATGQGFVSLLR